MVRTAGHGILFGACGGSLALSAVLSMAGPIGLAALAQALHGLQHLNAVSDALASTARTHLLS